MAMHEGEEGMEEEVMPALTEAEAEALAQQLYVAYYGRPGDPDGLAFWTNEFMDSTNLDKALSDFGTSAEYSALSADKTSEELITSLYQRMFNRDPDMPGLEYYEGRLDSGEATLASIAKQIADGALDDDATALANKVAVANIFTAAVEDGGDTVVYDGSQIAHAAALLEGVGSAEGAVAAGEAAVADLIALMDGGMEYTLTMGRDIFESGTGNDTFTATSDTATAAATGDAIRDASTTDHDSLTITNTTGVEAISVVNVEYINVIQDMFDGGEEAALIELANVEGATVTISSEKLGYDGDARVSGIYNNTLVAGARVTGQLITFDIDNAIIDLGNAKSALICTINVDPDGAGDGMDTTGPTVMINGDVDLTVKGSNSTQTVREDTDFTYSPTYTLMGVADAKVTLTASRDMETGGDLVPFEVAGAGDLTLMMASANGAKISNKSTGNLMVVSAGTETTNVSGVESAVMFSGDLAAAAEVTAATGQMIVFSKAQMNAITVMGSKDTDNLAVTSTDLGTVPAAAAPTGGITFAVAATASLTVVGADAKATSAAVGALTSDAIPLSVTSSLKALTVGSLKAENADFSGVDGALTIRGITGPSEVTGGAGANTVFLVSPLAVGTSFVSTLGYTGGAGSDTVIATNVGATGRVEASLGAGNDRIVVNTAAEGARVAVDGGAGINTLVVQTDEVGDPGIADISGFTRLHMTNIQALAFAGSSAADADHGMDNPATMDMDERAEMLTATMSLEQLEPAYIVALADTKQNGGPGVDSVTINVMNLKNAATIDLSHLTVLDAAKVSFAITGDDTKATTIIGSGGGDNIDAGAFDGDTITGGGGADTFVFEVDDSYEEAMPDATPAVALAYDTIMYFSISQKDVIDFTGGTATVVDDVELVAFEAGDTDALAVFEGAQSTVRFQIKDGVLTLEGLRSDRAMADTLDEWLDLAEAAAPTAGVLAFVFEGDTYIHQGNGTDTDNLIKLEGVTGITLTAADTAADDLVATDALIA